MDPKANITRQRELSIEILDYIRYRNPDKPARMALELAELVQALDEWRLKGGYDPYVSDTERETRSIERGTL